MNPNVARDTKQQSLQLDLLVAAASALASGWEKIRHKCVLTRHIDHSCCFDPPPVEIRAKHAPARAVTEFPTEEVVAGTGNS